MFDLGTVGSAVVMDGSQFFGTLNQLHGRTNSTMLQIQQIMTRVLGVYGVVKLFREAGKAGNEFGDELANIESIANDIDMRVVQRGLLELNSNLGKSATLANSFYYAYSAGMRGTARELVNFTAQMSQGAKAVRAEQVPYMDAATTTINSYGLALKDAGMINDWFYQIVKQGKTTGAELAQNIGDIVGTAAQAGLALDQLGAGIAALTQVMSTPRAIVGLNQALLAFIKPSKMARDAAESVGIELSAAALKSKGLVEAFREIEEKAGDNVEVLSAMFGNVRAFRVAAQLAGEQSKKFTSILGEFKTKGGTSLRAFETQVRSTGQLWRNAMTDWNKSLIDLANTFDPVSRKIAEMISYLSQNRGAVVLAGGAVVMITAGTIKWLVQLARVPGAILRVSSSLGVNTTAVNANSIALQRNIMLHQQLRAQRMDDLYVMAGRRAGMYNNQLSALRMTVRNLTASGGSNITKTSLMAKSWLAAAGAAKTLGAAAKMAAGNIGLVGAVGYGGYKAGNWIYDNYLKDMDEKDELNQVHKAQKKINAMQTGQGDLNSENKARSLIHYLNQAKRSGRVTDKEYQDILKRYNSKDTDISQKAYQEARDRSENKNQYADRAEQLRLKNEEIRKQFEEKRRHDQEVQINAIRNRGNAYEQYQTAKSQRIQNIKSMLFMDDGKFSIQDQQEINLREIDLQEKKIEKLKDLKESALDAGMKKETEAWQKKYNEEVESYRQMLERKKELDKKYLEEKKKADPRQQLAELRRGFRVRQSILDRDNGAAGSSKSQIRDFLNVSTPEERKEWQKIRSQFMNKTYYGSGNEREQAAFIKFTEMMKRKQEKDDAKLSDVVNKMGTIISKLETIAKSGGSWTPAN